MPSLWPFPAFCSLLFNAADIVVVGQLVPAARRWRRSGSTSALINLIVNLFIGLSIGVNVAGGAATMARGNHNGFAWRPSTPPCSVSVDLRRSILIFVGIGLVPAFAGADGHPGQRHRPVGAVHAHLLCGDACPSCFTTLARPSCRAIGDTQRPALLLDRWPASSMCFLNLFFVIVFHMGVAGVAHGDHHFPDAFRRFWFCCAW